MGEHLLQKVRTGRIGAPAPVQRVQTTPGRDRNAAAAWLPPPRRRLPVQPSHSFTWDAIDAAHDHG